MTRPSPQFRAGSAYALVAHLHRRTAERVKELAAEDPTDFAALTVALHDARMTVEGLQRYQDVPFRRFAPEPPTVWRKGAFRLLDFGGSGRPVVVVPSLVNRWTILDLTPERSPVRWLARQGHRVFLVDWGVPDGDECGYTLDAYLRQRLWPALDAAARITSDRVALIGYCMGGPIVLASAAHHAQTVRKVVTLGAPWDFSAFPEHEILKRTRTHVERTLTTMERAFGVVPPQITQTFFAMRNLDAGITKFRKFATADVDTPRAQRFIAVEDWLNEGAPLAVGVARECFIDWMMDDGLRARRWIVGGQPFDAADLAQEALVVAAQRDTVVRTRAAEPLAHALPRARFMTPDAGHIGMVVGERALDDVWRPIADFLAE